MLATGLVAGAGAIVAQTPGGDPNVASRSKPIDATPSDHERFQGRWTVIKASEDPNDPNHPDFLGSILTFRGDELDFQMRKVPLMHYRFKLDPDADPKSLRLVPANPKEDAPTRCHYAFEGAKLRLTFVDQKQAKRRQLS